MRVLYWTQLYWPDLGGMEVQALRLLPELRRRGHEITVVTGAGPMPAEARSTVDGIEVHRFPFRTVIAEKQPGPILRLKAAIAALKRQLKPDLIHVQLPGVDTFFHLATEAAHPAAVLLTLHMPFNLGFGTGQDTLLGRLMDSAVWITAVSQATLEAGITASPQIRGRSSVVYNGIPLEGPQPQPADPTTQRILCLGRLSFEKGFDVALRTFALLAPRYPRARLTIAGDGPDRASLRRLASELELEERVDFPGWVDPVEVPALLASSNLVLIPSVFEESFGLVAIEAGMAERPIIATRSGGLLETVQHGQTGLLVPQGDAEAFAAAAASLLDRPEEAARLGRQGRQHVLQRFGIGACADAFDDLYRRLGSSACQEVLPHD